MRTPRIGMDFRFPPGLAVKNVPLLGPRTPPASQGLRPAPQRRNRSSPIAAAGAPETGDKLVSTNGHVHELAGSTASA